MSPRSTNRSIKTAFALACVLVGTGCGHPWYLVESTYMMPNENFGAPEVVQTDAYRRVSKGPLMVALRAPDRCADLSSAQTTGDANSTSELIRTTCGVEMAELERALVRSGYRVVSWNAVHAMVVHEAHVTPLEAAKSLGANTLFQVNSLEQSSVTAGLVNLWHRTFFESDSQGRKGKPAKVPEPRARALEEHMRPLEKSMQPPDRFSVTVDVTAVDTSSGEAIWFYSATRAVDAGDEVKTESPKATQLFECNRRRLQRCLLRSPRVVPSAASLGPSPMNGQGFHAGSASRRRSARRTKTPEPEDVEPKRSGGDNLSFTPDQMSALSRSAYLKLLRETMADLVDEFATGEK